MLRKPAKSAHARPSRAASSGSSLVGSCNDLHTAHLLAGSPHVLFTTFVRLSSTPMLGNVSVNPYGSKPLPSPKDDRLPPLPPSDRFDNAPSFAPAPLPKHAQEQGLGMSQRANNSLPPIDTFTRSPNDGTDIVRAAQSSTSPCISMS